MKTAMGATQRAGSPQTPNSTGMLRVTHTAGIYLAKISGVKPKFSSLKIVRKTSVFFKRFF